MASRTRRRLEFLFDQADRHVDISAVAQSPPHLPQGTYQFAAPVVPRFRKQHAEDFLKSAAPYARIMNGLRMVAHDHFCKQGDELLKPLLSYAEKPFLMRRGFSRILLCVDHDPLTFAGL